MHLAANVNMKLSESNTADHGTVRQTNLIVPTKTALLLPRISGWAQQLAPEDRFPRLESFLARATVSRPVATELDRLRLRLFGLPADEEVPVAALSRLAATSVDVDESSYYLRMDPVTLQADMSRLVLINSGFAGFPVDYHQTVLQIVGQVMQAEGLDLQTADDYWTIRLPQHPEVQFTSLDEALGADVFECLPEGKAGHYWKKLQNEIQMALHANPENEQRRERGAAVINSVWFWGGGRLPKPAVTKTFDRVYSADPVSQGLAILQGMQLKELSELPANGELFENNENDSVLVDWAVAPSASEHAAQPVTPIRLDVFCQGLLAELKRKGGRVCLYSPERSWCLGTGHLLRFWRRHKALSLQLAALQNQP